MEHNFNHIVIKYLLCVWFFYIYSVVISILIIISNRVLEAEHYELVFDDDFVADNFFFL